MSVTKNIFSNVNYKMMESVYPNAYNIICNYLKKYLDIFTEKNYNIFKVVIRW